MKAPTPSRILRRLKTIWRQATIGTYQQLIPYLLQHCPWMIVPLKHEYSPWFLSPLDSIGHDIFHGEYEVGDLAFVSKYLQPGMHCIDIGANFGLVSLTMARQVGPTGEVLAFEPAPGQYRLLRLNRWLHRFSQIKTFPVAVTRTAGSLSFHLITGQANQGLHTSVFPPYWAAGKAVPHRTITVPAVSLDALWKNKGVSRCDLIKIDVEGAEDQVLQGGLRFFQRFKPVVLLEISDHSLPVLLPLIRKMQYRLMKTDHQGKLTPVTVPKLSRYFARNFVLLPR